MRAREGEALGGPRLQNNLQILVEALPTLGKWRVKAVVRVRESATPDPELYPPLTDVVQSSDVFGEADRIAQGQQDDSKPNADALGAGGDGGGNCDGGGEYTEGGKMVL